MLGKVMQNFRKLAHLGKPKNREELHNNVKKILILKFSSWEVYRHRGELRVICQPSDELAKY